MSKLKFPTMLRKMWSGAEVQAWLDLHLNDTSTQAHSLENLQEAEAHFNDQDKIAFMNARRDQAMKGTGSWFFAGAKAEQDWQEMIERSKKPKRPELSPQYTAEEEVQNTKLWFVMAANAAGYPIAKGEHILIPSGGIYLIGAHGQDVAWNPRDVDIDAFKLAVDLGLSLEIDDSTKPAPATLVTKEGLGAVACVNHHRDKQGATRKAIWLAAVKVQEIKERGL